MERRVKIALAALLVAMTGVAAVNGQEKKTEKKTEKQVKVIITDNSGTKVVIDTVLTGKTGVKSAEGVMIIDDEDPSNIIVMKSSKDEGSGKVMTWTAVDGSETGKNVIYISKSDAAVKEGEVVYNVEVKTDATGKSVEKSSYIIAKDGMVVSIEGSDEEKVKELAKMIEDKLGVSKEGAKEVKEETKKSVKK